MLALREGTRPRHRRPRPGRQSDSNSGSPTPTPIQSTLALAGFGNAPRPANESVKRGWVTFCLESVEKSVVGHVVERDRGTAG